MARRYYSSTARRTTLASDINSSVTSLTVAAVSGWPSSFPYTLCIDEGTLSEELVEVTARSGTTVTVTRGVDGSTAVAHTAGATVNHAVSARDFNEPNQFLNEGGTITASGSSAALTIANTGSGDSLRVEDSSSPDSTPFVVSASGDVGVGTGSPAQKLDVVGTVASTGLAVTGTGLVSANSSGNAFEIRQTGAGNALVVEDSANPDATPFVVNNNGVLLSGNTTSAQFNHYSSAMRVQISHTSSNMAQLATFADDAFGADVVFTKSRAASIGTNTVVSSGDALGNLIFIGADGTNYVRAAQISAAVDGTPGTNDMPGRLVFSTTADGASSPTERMRITNAGNVGIGTGATIGARFHVSQADTAVQSLFSGTTRGVRIGHSSTGSVIEGVDHTGAGSYQPLIVGGSDVRFTTSATERMRIDNAGLITGTGTSLGAWTSYTVSWTTAGTQPVLGNGTVVGGYVRIGKIVRFRILLTLGSTSTVGTGGWIFDLPVAATSTVQDFGVTGSAVDVSASAWYALGSERIDTTRFYIRNIATNARVTPTVPFTWTPADADFVVVTGAYEIA